MQKSSKTLSDSCGICEGKKKDLFISVTSTCSDIMMVAVRIAFTEPWASTVLLVQPVCIQVQRETAGCNLELLGTRIVEALLEIVVWQN